MNELLDRTKKTVGRITMAEVKALHEAGHVVVAQALGIPIEQVSLITDPPSTRYGRSRTPEEGVWTTQAGRFSVLVLTGSKELADWGTEADLYFLNQFLKGFASDRHREASITKADTHLPRLIDKNKDAIQIVADELLRHGLVSGKRLSAILRGSLRKHSLWFRALNWIKLQILKR